MTTAAKRIMITVNGRRRELYVDPRRALLDVLREDLDLTGAKRSCDDGECGSCIVLLGSKGVMSCLLPVYRVGNKEVTTIEGLAPHFYNKPQSQDGALEGLHPLQRAFVECGASQCGFCIPAMIMEADALLKSNPNPTREDIVKRLSRNLCRCTGYIKIIDAVLYAAELMRGGEVVARQDDGSGHVVGESVLQLDAVDEVTGRAMYAADLKKEGMLYARILRSPHHHANILSIDTSQAEIMPGVEAVITARDVPGKAAMLNGRPQPFFLAQDKVRYMGEAVAAVAAVSEEIAAEALKRIRVDYDPLPAVFDPVEAMRDDAPKLYPPYKNFIAASEVVQGDVEKGFAQADVVVENTYDTLPWEHAAMEPEAGLAYLDDEDRVVIHTPLHHPFAGQIWVAELAGIEHERVRIICPAMGGNFGMRGDFLHAGVLALFVLKTRRPVKIVYTREESMIGSSKSNSYHLRYRTGATRDGKLVALEAEIIGDGGCWIPIPELTGKPPTIRVHNLFPPGPYYVPNAYIKMYEACTNRPRSIPMRGSTIPQMALAWDSQMDMLAAKLGLDPLEFRLRNALELGHSTITGQVLDESVGAKATIEALKGPYAEARDRKASEPPPYPWKRGVGIGSAWQVNGGGRGEDAGGGWHGLKLGHARAGVELLEDGRVRVLTGIVEKGQGISTAIAQVAAEALGMPLKSLVMVFGDTFLAPYPVGTSGQRTGFHVGGAVVRACQGLKQAMIQAAAEIMESSPEELVIKDGYTFSPRFPKDKLSFRQVAARLRSKGLPMKYEGTFVFEKSEKGQGPVIGFASQLTELDVNVETGQVKVLRVAYAADLGRVINPQSFEGQAEGGVAMGLSYALRERYVPGETRTLKSYGLPTIKDVPEEVKTLIVGEPVFGGPFGAKGASEMTVSPSAPSVINAIADATGARIYRLPATPERVLKALRKGS